ncbi:MAG: ribonuclease Y [Candidatus Woesebacteria bacterium]|jgi:ribonuclease Y
MSFFNNLSVLFGKQKSKGAVVKSSKKQTIKKVPAAKVKRKFGPQDSTKKALKPQAPTQFKPVAKVNFDATLREAKAQAKEIIVEAKDEALAIRSQAEKKAHEVEKQLMKQQNFLERKLDRLDERLSQMDKKEKELNEKSTENFQLKEQLEKSKKKLLKRLEEISGMNKDQAKKILLDGLEKQLTKEMAQLIRQKKEKAEATADAEAKEILVSAMRHGATDYVAEYTVSVVTLANEEIKGKIIGKSGRNIHTFERKTGVNVDLDSSPTEVKLSSFDPVRREIARISLERLIKDGRIQPARIEEVVDRVKKEVDKIIFEAGKKLCHEVGVYNLPNELMKILGRFKYRFSYGQNMIDHTLEETKIGVKLAQEVKADVNIVRLGCLLHDVGKVVDEGDGSHVELGVKLVKKFGMPQPIIDCIAQHHEDEPFTGTEQILVYIADAISGARPGARYENFDEYVQRLEELEKIASSYKEVKEAYAIQAGRELRVLLSPEQSKEDDVTVLAGKIKTDVESNLTYPGTVTVTVIRETRAQDVAK